jgi:hypothetical protein
MNALNDAVRNESARRIQRTWRAFATDRRYVTEDSRVLASRIANPVISESAYYKTLSNKGVLFYLNGAPGDPLSRHSAFIFDNALWHLTIGVKSKMAARGDCSFSRYPIAHRPRRDLYSAICCKDTWASKDPDHPAKMMYLVRKGIFFALREQYVPLFLPAFHAEREQFMASPLSYGLHYNCNTLIRNVLRRILQFAIRSSV